MLTFEVQSGRDGPVSMELAKGPTAPHRNPQRVLPWVPPESSFENPPSPTNSANSAGVFMCQFSRRTK